MTVFPLLLYTVCHHCLQCIDFPSNRHSFYACWWQSDNLLQMLRAPPEAYLISWILLYHPSPPASLFDCLLLWPGLGVVSMWACRGLQSEGTSITECPPAPPPLPSGLRGGSPGRSLVRAGFFRPRSLPCLLHLISSSLHPSVSLPSQTVKACKGQTLSLRVPVRISLPFSLSGFPLPYSAACVVRRY